MVDHISNIEWDNEIILSLSTLLGFHKIDRRYKSFMDKFLELNSSIGVLGGH